MGTGRAGVRGRTGSARGRHLESDGGEPAYYACFHAAQAALYSRGFDPSSHGAVGTLLGRELVGDGDIDRQHGRFLNDMESFRRRVDYGSGAVERGTDDLLEGTEAFLNAMRTALDDESITE